MKLMLTDLTWNDTNIIGVVYKTDFIHTIDGDVYIKVNSADIDHLLKNGDITTNKTYKDGGCKIRRCINIGDKWYEFTMSPDDEEEYNDMLYFNLN